MQYSNETFSMILMPKTGRLVSITGNMAQWMAQANEVVIPRASQFILFPGIVWTNVINCNEVAKDFKIYKKCCGKNPW
jgi:hypothetical protein